MTQKKKAVPVVTRLIFVLLNWLVVSGGESKPTWCLDWLNGILAMIGKQGGGKGGEGAEEDLVLKKVFILEMGISNDDM